MLLVPIPQDANLVILVLIEVEPILLSIPQLQEVVVQRLLRDAYLLSSIFQGDTLVHIQPSPLTYLDHHLANDSLFLPPTAACLALARPAFYQRICVLAFCLLAQFDVDLVQRRRVLVTRFWLRA